VGDLREVFSKGNTMSIVSLADGSFQATVFFGIMTPRHFRYGSRDEAQELIDAEHVHKTLDSKGSQARCSDKRIVAAADAVANIPSDGNIDASNWARRIEHQIRSRVKGPRQASERQSAAISRTS
jgi:hypothetical protein